LNPKGQALKTKTIRWNAAQRQYQRDMGWKLTVNGEYRQHRFYLGQDETQAVARCVRLKELWRLVEANYEADQADCVYSSARPIWGGPLLLMAQAISNGKDTARIYRPDNFDNAKDWFRQQALWLGRLARRYPLVKLLPEQEGQFHDENGQPMFQPDGTPIDVGELIHFWGLGVDAVADFKQRQALHEVMKQNLATNPYGTGNEGKGPTLHQALDTFQVYMDKKTTDENTGEVSLERNQARNQIKEFKARYADFPLSEMDKESCEDMRRLWENRPISSKTGEQLAWATCRNHTRRLDSFWKWLHSSKAFAWREPEGLRDNRRPIKRTDKERSALVTGIGVEVFTDQQLKTIFKNTNDLERLFLLLGLNCGFAPSEIGTLRRSEIYLFQKHPHADKLHFETSDQDCFIRRLRLKANTCSQWKLWPMTVKALQWGLAQADRHSKTHGIKVEADSLALLTQKATPYWKKTKSLSENARGS
jgi:hypothetical protein